MVKPKEKPNKKMDELLQTVDNVISYFKYHNKNLNRGQENQLDKLEEIFYKVK